MNLYAYTCRTARDSTGLQAEVDVACCPWRAKFASHVWMGLTQDVFPQLERTWRKRPGATLIRERLMVGDAILFWGIERCFASVRDMIATVDDLIELELTVILADLGLQVGNSTGNAVWAIIKRMAAFEKLSKDALRKPKLV